MRNTDSKERLHPRSKHRERYDLDKLTIKCPELSNFVRPNKYDDPSIDFADPKAVRVLNKALLLHHYGLEYWDIPVDYLTPPVPGRADYIHHIADQLAKTNKKEIPRGPEVKVLDIGVGANCIYPIIGTAEYGWTFVGTDIDPVSIASCNNIIAKNPSLTDKVSVRLQEYPKNIFKGIIKEDDKFDLVICNPPFHASLADSKEAAKRKLSKLTGKKVEEIKLNFGGKSNELWTEGGELQFIQTMIYQGKKYKDQINWFSTLVSKATHVKHVHKMLRDASVRKIEVTDMGTGNKVSRIISWLV